MPEPIVSVTSVDKSKISDEVSMDKSIVTFHFDIPIQEYTVRVVGTSHDTGTIADGKSFYVSDLAAMTVADVESKTVNEIRQIDGVTDIQATIDWNELYQEGINRVNIYGKSIDGTWSSYNQA